MKEQDDRTLDTEDAAAPAKASWKQLFMAKHNEKPSAAPSAEPLTQQEEAVGNTAVASPAAAQPNLHHRALMVLAEKLALTGADSLLDDSFFIDGDIAPTDAQVAFLDTISVSIQQELTLADALKREKERERMQAEVKAHEEADKRKRERAQDLADQKARAEANGEEFVPEPEEEDEPEPEVIEPEAPPAVDMRLFVGISPSGLEAFGFLLPPDGGADLDEAALAAQLAAQSISFGVDMPAILEAISQKRWMKVFVLARGEAPQDGQDGFLTEYYSRDKKIRLSENVDQSMDYKNLNWLQSIAVDGVICDVAAPTRGQNGTTVTGKPLVAHEGKAAVIPSGTNTHMNEEQTALLASCDGHLNFSNNMFHVQQSLHIPGNVDNSVGNLKVAGDIVIDGNVASGYTIEARGNVQVRGLVEGAHIISGADIQVGLGMKGNGKGVLEAGKNVRCKYLENCIVKAGQSVISDTIVNSTVQSRGSIRAMTGLGVIIGGKLTALELIEAKEIGNESNLATYVCVGVDSLQQEAVQLLQKELLTVLRSIEELEKNILYYETQTDLDTMHAERLTQLRLKLSIEKMAQKKKEKSLQAQLAQQVEVKGQILTQTLYPLVTIEISNLKMVVQKQSASCRVYAENGEIVIGKK